MTEIRTAIDFRHPPDRVWQALTDRRLLAQWFVEAELLPDETTDGDRTPTGGGTATPGLPAGTAAAAGGTLLLHTADLPGFAGPARVQVIGCREPRSLVLRWTEPERSGLVECTLDTTSNGCRVALRETLESGGWTPAYRRQRQESYQQVLTNRLPAVLDWLAFREVDLEPPATAGTTPVAPSGPVTPPWRRPALVAVTAGVLVAGAGGLWLTGQGGQPADAGSSSPTSPVGEPTGPDGAPSRALTPAARATTRPGPTRTATDRPTPRAARTTGGAPTAGDFTARYTTVDTQALGFTGQVVLDNDGPGTARDWTVTITLGALGRVTGVSGAEFAQQGRTVTFTGAAVPRGRSRTFQFEVTGIDRTTSCTVDSTPCVMA
ncbi:SRPBCC domain-containing protein [Micromonospora sp. CPCC 206060]|uniref:SRPBCC domain-containing protein n=1 Tax=Micromonospora sp. CPCC 206060 TaxID=3122406 RepID=UPI002FF3A07B